MVRPATRVTSL